LIAAGHDVTFVDTDREHIAAIRERGFTLEAVSSLMVRPKAAIHPAELPAPLGTVICAVKTLHTQTAMEPIAPLLGRDEFVLSMQNGLAYCDIVAAVGRERTLVGCFNFGGHYEGPGRLVHGTKGGLHVGELDGGVTNRLRARRGRPA